MMRSILIAAGLLSTWMCPTRAAAREALCSGCSVVLVTIDLLRADELRPAGGGKEIMPNLDAMAARGIVFSDVFSPSPDTMPSTLSIMNGLYPSHHGARVPLRDKAIQDKWAGSERTIAAVLRRQGYEVHGLYLDGSSTLNSLLGKEGPLGEPPSSGTLRGKKIFLQVRGGVHDPYAPALDDVRALQPEIAQTAYPTAEDVRRCEIASWLTKKVPESMRFSGELGEAGLVTVSEPFLDQARRVVEGAGPAERLRAVRELDPESQYVLASLCYWSFFSSSTIDTARLLYDAELRSVDRALGGMLRRLESEGLLDHTLVVVTSQHGEEFLEHGHVTHSAQLYEESLHVPLILLLPGMKTGRVAGGVSSSVDVMPTILGALGIKPPGALDGRDLLHCLDGGCAERYVFSECGDDTFSVRDDRYSYIQRPSREELFDRRLDPGERHDIVSREPKALSRMRAALSREMTDRSDYKGRWPAWVSEKVRAQIIKEGYW